MRAKVCERGVPVLGGFLALLLAAWVLGAAAPLSAQGVPAGGGLAHGLAAMNASERRSFANESINEAVNTTMLFASQDLFSTGRFAKHRIDQPDTHYDTIRAPFEVRLRESDARWQPYLSGSGALLQVSSGATKPLEATGADDQAGSTLFSFAAGIGTYLRIDEHLKVSAAIQVAYSHLRNSYDFNNSYSRQNFAPEDDLYYNWSLNLFTYAPTLRAVYEYSWSETFLQYTLGYSQFFNDSVGSSSRAIDIDSASGLAWNRLAVTEPTGLTLGGAPASIRPFFQWSNISGQAADGLDLVHLYEVGADVVLSFKEKFWLFSQMYWGGSYVSGDSFEGYHVGFGGKF
jgi:hypothetical protein